MANARENKNETKERNVRKKCNKIFMKTSFVLWFALFGIKTLKRWFVVRGGTSR